MAVMLTILTRVCSCWKYTELGNMLPTHTSLLMSSNVCWTQAQCWQHVNISQTFGLISNPNQILNGINICYRGPCLTLSAIDEMYIQFTLACQQHASMKKLLHPICVIDTCCQLANASQWPNYILPCCQYLHGWLCYSKVNVSFYLHPSWLWLSAVVWHKFHLPWWS